MPLRHATVRGAPRRGQGHSNLLKIFFILLNVYNDRFNVAAIAPKISMVLFFMEINCFFLPVSIFSPSKENG